MEIIRYMFFIFILIGSTSIGFILSKSYTYRIKELNELLKLINIMQNKIKFTRKPLAEVLEETSQIKEETNISNIFLITSTELKKQKIEDAWKKGVNETKNTLNLNKNDINLILTLGNVLGKTDVEGQISEKNQFSSLLKTQITEAIEEKNKNAKMYKSLGTLIGLAIIIILF